MKAARPALAQFDVTEDGDMMRAVVTLAWRDQAHEGRAATSAVPELIPRLIGEATLDALMIMTGGAVELDLEAVATTDLGASRVAIAQVRTSRPPGWLVGSAVIHEDDPAKATARAVLDAVNRHLEQLL